MTSSPYVLYKRWLLLGVISIQSCTPAGFKLTKLFGIDDFSAAKDFGKVFIIIIYCFYNYCINIIFILIIIITRKKCNSNAIDLTCLLLTSKNLKMKSVLKLKSLMTSSLIADKIIKLAEKLELQHTSDSSSNKYNFETNQNPARQERR